MRGKERGRGGGERGRERGRGKREREGKRRRKKRRVRKKGKEKGESEGKREGGKGDRGKEEREEGEKEGRKREEGERKGKERGNGERFKSLLDERDELYIDYRPGPIHGLMCHDAAESPASMHASHGSLACHARRPVESPTTRLQITLTETHTLLDPASGSTSCTWPSGRRRACPMRRRGPCRSRRRPCLGSP